MRAARVALAFGALLCAIPAATARDYVVRPGDSISRIAERELGDRDAWRAIAHENGIADPARIRPGDVLRLPDGPAEGIEVAAVETEPPTSMTEPLSTSPPLSSLPLIPDTAPAGAVPAWPDRLRPRTAREAEGGLAGAPLALDAAVAIGLARAPEIRAAEAEVERVRGTLGVARSGALPQVTATGDARRSETWKSTSVFGVDEATYGGTLNLSQSIFSFGRLSHAIAAANADEAAAIADLAAVRIQVRFQVEAAFLNLLLERERLAVARAALEASEALRRRAILLEEAGSGTRFDVTRAEAERASALARIVAAQSALDMSQEALSSAMGLAPGARFEAAGDLSSEAVPVSPDAAETLALAERPDIASFAKKIESSRSRAEYERALGRPSLSAVASATYTRHEYISQSTFFKGNDASSGYAGVSLSVPIFDGGRVRESALAQEAATDRLEAQFERLRLTAAAEVRAAYFELGAARETLAARREAVRAAREAYRMSEVSFVAGRATALDVIQASLTLSEAGKGEAEAAHAYRLGLAKLVRAAGTTEVLEGTVAP